MAEPERLQKALSRAGFGSRRASEVLIEDGRVTVDGRVAELGNRVDADSQEIRVDGKLIPAAPSAVYFLLNKPEGFVTTAHDPQGRPTVLDLVPTPVRVFPVGRLDMNSEGLLLLTNDGRLAHLLMHPSHGVEKEYLVRVDGDPSPTNIRRLREGIVLEDGVTAPARVNRISDGVLRIVIHEGRNRQVRRMCEAIGHEVLRLVRTRIGPIHDAKLAPGQCRALSTSEVKKLMDAVREPDTPTSTLAP
ncbi:MAG: rRNA pseudouridine synthase [Acidobacteria bacterium]|nr:rRNA pseudouridine synthase [Acidobacteriota bacterium]